MNLVCLGRYIPTPSRKYGELQLLVRLLFVLFELSDDMKLAKAILPDKKMLSFMSKCLFFIWSAWICGVQNPFFIHAQTFFPSL